MKEKEKERGEGERKREERGERTVRLLRLRHVELAEPKIAQRDVARIIEQNILRFQVAAGGQGAFDVAKRVAGRESTVRIDVISSR